MGVVAEVEQESRCLTTQGGGLPHFGRRMFPGASALEAQNQLFALVGVRATEKLQVLAPSRDDRLNLVEFSTQAHSSSHKFDCLKKRSTRSPRKTTRTSFWPTTVLGEPVAFSLVIHLQYVGSR